MARIINGITIPDNAVNGGWYSGRQLWDNTLSEPGQINSRSNQVGAGQQVSNEVVAQTNPNNVAYIQQQRQQAQPAATTPTPTVGGGGASGGGASANVGAGVPVDLSMLKQPTIDLPALYQGLYEKSGVKDLTEQITTAEKQFLEAKAKISDNPFLDASTIDKRLQRLQNTYDTQVKPMQDSIALKNTDIQNQLKLQTDQFNINSEQAKLAMSQFQALLSSGALDNADANSIINVANATGLSTSMIQSAISANQKKNNPVSIQSFDDGTNQGYVTIDSQGNIINKQTVGASKPSATSATATAANEKTQNTANLTKSIQNGITLKSLFGAFYPALDAQTIYNLYNQYTTNGKAKESLPDIKKWLDGSGSSPFSY